MIEKMKIYANENDVPIMMDEGINFLCDYIKNNDCKAILECGTAIGYSSIKMAEISPEIVIDTCEINEKSVEIARKNIQESKLENRISVFFGDAMEFQTEKQYDLIFVDAAKSQYRKYMEHFSKNLKPEGVFIFDNLEFHGMVDHPERSKSRNTKQLLKKIRAFRSYIQEEPTLETKYYPTIGDGVAVVRLKKDKKS